MTLVSGISDLASRISTEFNSIRTALSGKANTSHTHSVGDLTATGTKSSTTFLRGDNTWSVPGGGLNVVPITDWDNAKTNGVYSSVASSTAHAPNTTDNWVGEVIGDNATNWCTQTLLQMTTAATRARYRREYVAGTWSSWVLVQETRAEQDARYELLIAAGTTAQYRRGDKTWQTLNSTAVGLGNVPNVNATNASNLASGTVPDARLSSRLSDGSLQAKYLAAVQAGAPAAPTIGQQWWDSNNYAMKVWDGTAWIRTGLPAGVLAMTHKSVVPPGWLACDGSAVAAKYTDLIAYLGGTTTPNINDRTLRISGTNDLSPAPGATGGGDSVVLSTDQLPSHDHDMGHDHPSSTLAFQAANDVASTGGSTRVSDIQDLTGAGGGVYNATINIITRDKRTGNTGSGNSVDLTNRYYGVKLLIKT